MNKIQRIVFTMACLLTVTAGYAHKIMAFYSENGTVTATVNSASITVGTDDIAVNSPVTLTITPNASYYVSKIEYERVMDLGNAESPRRRVGFGTVYNISVNTTDAAYINAHYGGNYTFTMPDYDIVVTVTYASCTLITGATVHWDTWDGTSSAPTSIEYDALEHTANVWLGSADLTVGTDYSITTNTLTNAGSISPTITGIGTYSGSISSGTTLTITKAPLTITADDKTKQYRDAVPTLTATYSGFKGSETNSVLSTQPTLSTSANQDSNVGNYTITISGATAINYTITHTAGQLTITQRVMKDNTVDYASVTVTPDHFDADGSAHEPSITIVDASDGNRTLTLTTDYTIGKTGTYVNVNSPDFKTPDIYNFIITFTGNYTGTKTVDYQIRQEITLNNNNGHRWRTYYNKTYNMEVTNDFEAFTVSSITTNSVILNGPKAVIKSATPMLLYRKTGTASGIYPALIKPSDTRLDDANWTGASTYLKCHVDGGGTPTDWDLDNDGGITGGTTKIMILVDDKFAYSKSGTLAAGKCYLDVSPVSPSPAPSLIIGTNPTGIEEETIKDFDLNGVWYTLDGRQIQGVPAQKGIYIKNGKKIIIK